MRNYSIARITVLISIILSIVLVEKLALAQQTEPPAVGAFFYGKATVNGRNVPINSYVIAKIENATKGQIKVESIGNYGVEKGDRKLGVSGSPSTSGKEIQFFVKLPKLKEIKARQTAEWQSGEITKLDLTFIGPEIVDNTTEIVELAEFPLKEVFFYNKIIAGQQVAIFIENPNIPIIRVQLIVNQNLSNVTFEFEATNTPNAPKLDRVYKYIWINAPKIEQSIVDTAIIRFKVPNEWFTNNSYDPKSVKLLRYHNNTWNELETYDEGNDANDNYYRSVTPGFSYFAIRAQSGKPSATTTELENVTAENKQTETVKETEEQKEAEKPSQGLQPVTAFVVEKFRTNPIIGVVLVLVGIGVGILLTYFIVARKKSNE